MTRPKPVVLIILDGWGINPQKEANAIALADPPFYNHLLQTYAHTTLSASGEDVGLPEGQMGNSEVGHMNMGAGRIIYQDFTRINKAISDRSFYQNAELLTGMSLQEGQTLHLMGLLSDGGVHSHIDHLMALLEMARAKKVQSLVVHPFLDGRDTPPKSALLYLKQLEEALRKGSRAVSASPLFPHSQTASWRMGTVMGRYYAMDRDHRWDRVEKAYRALVAGEGTRVASLFDALEKSFEAGITDEFVSPIVICDKTPVGRIRDHDRILFYNFRADRARQLTRAFIEEGFAAFKREKRVSISSFVTLTQYDKAFSCPSAFSPINLSNMLGEVISKNGLKQCRIAETEKYAHVTYFFNGGREDPFDGEERTLIPSPKDVATYDQKPEMSADEVAETARQQIETGQFDLIVMNFANPDMVGHSGNLKAAIEAVRVIDRCLEKVIGATQRAGGAALITADHGNLEQMVDDTGAPHTAHTTLPVPLIFIPSDKESDPRTVRHGIHANIAPTLLDLLEIPKPKEMDQESLLKK